MRGIMGKARFTLCYGTLLLGVVLLSGCGGSGGGTVADGGIGGSGLTSGEIEGFGSIIVNGVKFEVEGAEVETEHGVTIIISSATQTQHLAEGMQVEAEVAFNDDGKTGTATRIIIDDELEGEVTSLSTDPDSGIVTFTVLGQNVTAIPGETHIDDSAPLSGSLVNLASGMYVEVHGLPDGNSNLQATFIEFKADNLIDFNLLGDEGEFEVTGAISAMSAANLFNLGADLLVDYTGVTPDGPLAIGTLVEVKGSLDTSTTPDTLNASRVHVEDGFGDNVAKVEVEGLVRDLSASTFTLKGQLVNYSAATFFGGASADLAEGIKVEAEGPIVGSTLQAIKIKFKDNFRYEGSATKQPDGSWLIINPDAAGTDLSIWLDSLTRDDANAASDISGTTRSLKIRARQMEGAELLATRVEDDGGGNATRQIFEAIVIVKGDPVLQILNNGSGSAGLLSFDTTITADLQASDFQIEDVVTSRAAFMAALNVGDTVKARYDDGVEDEVEIELDD